MSDIELDTLPPLPGQISFFGGATDGPYGGTPHVADDPTSEAAAATVDRGASQAEVLAVIEAAGLHGITCGHVEQLLPNRTHQSVSARIREMTLATETRDALVLIRLAEHNGPILTREAPSGRQQRVYVAATHASGGLPARPGEVKTASRPSDHAQRMARVEAAGLDIVSFEEASAVYWGDDG